MLVIELKSGDYSSAFYSKSFVAKLKDVIEPDGNCKKLGIIFAWKNVESVVNLDCDYKRCYTVEGRNVANKVTQSMSRDRYEYSRQVFINAMDMAVNQLRPAGFTLKDKKEKVTRICYLRITMLLAQMAYIHVSYYIGATK